MQRRSGIAALLDEIVAWAGIKPQIAKWHHQPRERVVCGIGHRQPVALRRWQCRRTAPLCDELRAGLAPVFRAVGWSWTHISFGTKLKWLLDSDPHRGPGGWGAAFGTMDSWLITTSPGAKCMLPIIRTPPNLPSTSRS